MTQKTGLEGTGSFCKLKTIALSLIAAMLPSCLDPKAELIPDHEKARALMVESQLKTRDIHDPTVLNAMAKVPRHKFVDPEHAHRAYHDVALPIQEK